MTHLESGPLTNLSTWENEKVVFCVWGYLPPTRWEDPTKLFQVSMLHFMNGPRDEWAVGYLDPEDGDLSWYDYPAGQQFDETMQMWEDEVAQLRDKPYTEPEE